MDTAFYDEIAGYYGTFFRFKGGYDAELASEISKMLADHDCSSVLDCGCGNGNLCTGLALSGHKVTALDTSEKMLQHARELAEQLQAQVNFKFHDFRFLNELEDQFDCVIAHDSLYNFTCPDMLEEFIESCRGRLTSSGLLYIATKRWDSEKNCEARNKVEYRATLAHLGKEYVIMDICDLNELSVQMLEVNGTNISNLHQYTQTWYPHSPQVIASLMVNCGFKDVKITEPLSERKYNCASVTGYR